MLSQYVVYNLTTSFCRYPSRNQHHPVWVNEEAKKIKAVLFQVLFTGEPRSADTNSLPWSNAECSDKLPNGQLIFINWKCLCEFKIFVWIYASKTKHTLYLAHTRQRYTFIVCKYWSPIVLTSLRRKRRPILQLLYIVSFCRRFLPFNSKTIDNL